jgi:hypothetical protein
VTLPFDLEEEESVDDWDQHLVTHLARRSEPP